MKSKSESARRSRRPLIKAAPGMLAMTFFSGCRCRGYPYGGGDYAFGGGGSGGETASVGGAGGGAPTCTPTGTEEICDDTLDNDCDGTVDNAESCCSLPINSTSNCYTCAEAITFITCSTVKLCGEDPAGNTGSAQLYAEFAKCACEAGGACADQCAASFCMELPADVACDTCLIDEAAGCGKQYWACNADLP